MFVDFLPYRGQNYKEKSKTKIGQMDWVYSVDLKKISKFEKRIDQKDARGKIYDYLKFHEM